MNTLSKQQRPFRKGPHHQSAVPYIASKAGVYPLDQLFQLFYFIFLAFYKDTMDSPDYKDYVDDIFIFENDPNCYKININGEFIKLSSIGSNVSPSSSENYNISKLMRYFKDYLQKPMYDDRDPWHNPSVSGHRKLILEKIDKILGTYPAGKEYCFHEFLEFCDYIKGFLNCHNKFEELYRGIMTKSDLFKGHLPRLFFKHKKSHKKSNKKSNKKSPRLFHKKR